MSTATATSTAECSASRAWVLWLYDGDNDQWSQLHPFDASHLAAADLNGDGGEDVIVDFPGYGLWVLYGGSTWAQLNPRDVSALVTADLDGNGSKDLVMNFPGFGVWSYRIGVGWSLVNPVTRRDWRRATWTATACRTWSSISAPRSACGSCRTARPGGNCTP